MTEKIHDVGSRHVGEVRSINRELIEKSLHMRCLSYLAHVKAQLLTETIFEVESSRKVLLEINREISNQRELIASQKAELEAKNRELDAIRHELEDRVRERTAKLASANQQLRREMAEREAAEREKRELFEQLVQSQKMESIGRLAGGVAHDFNNLLAAIIASCHLALRAGPSGDIGEDLRQILAAGERAAVLTKQLLTFSRKQEMRLQQVDVNELVRRISGLLRRIIGSHIDVAFETTAEPAQVQADAAQIEQVLMNLAINARDAMPGGGHLLIETATIDRNQADGAGLEQLEPGKHVIISVSDTGEGMSDETRARIFEPFFTTKPEGEGTGLGLATVYGIVKQHRGYIEVHSEVGKGTIFTVYLPASDAAERTAEHDREPAIVVGTETILVVDGDPSVRRVIASTLRPLGYEVLEAAGYAEALAVASQTPESIDLLLTAVTLPDSSGPQLAAEIVGERPATKVVFMSWYANNVFVQRGVLTADAVFIPKPIMPSQLAVCVRHTLDRS